MAAQLAIAKKDIKTERFAVKTGEPLPSKYQLGSVFTWIKKTFGNDSIEVIQAPDHNKLYSLVHERQMRELNEEFSMAKAHRDELTARLNELEKKLKKT